MERSAVKTKEQESAQGAQAPAFQPPKKKRKWLKRLLIAVIVLGVIAFFLFRSLMGAGQQLLSGAYLSDTAQERDITVAVSSTGTVTPVDSYNVTPLVTGEVLEAPFEEGDVVEKGALLYRIDSSDAEKAIQQARIQVEQAQLNYDNLKNSAKDATLTANASGQIAKLYVEQGDMVTAGSPVADILDRSTVELKVPFHSQDAQALAVGTAAQVTMGGSMETLWGTVTEVSALEEVGAGGALVRQVTISVVNPGAITDASTATAVADGRACAASGAFSYAASQTVYAKTSGELATLTVKEGDMVTDGQVLGGFEADSVTTQVENARLSLESARLSLEKAEDALEDYTITAPISGTVVEKNFKAGDNLDSTALTAANGVMAMLYDMSTLTFEMKIDEKDINKIQVGQEVSITADAVEGETFRGHVDSININGTTVSGMTTYPITVVIEAAGALKPGMNVAADVIVERAGTVLSVPVEAVNRGSGKPVVTVVPASALDENGYVTDISQAQQREVELGRNDEKYIEITSGLSEGEVVIWVNEASNIWAAMMGM